ncbi:MAG: flagellar assembly protein A [Pseudomonadota bacterium]
MIRSGFQLVDILGHIWAEQNRFALYWCYHEVGWAKKAMEIKVKVATDKMTASLQVLRDEWDNIDVSSLEEALQKAGVVHGVDRGVLKKMVDIAAKRPDHVPISQTVAHGSKPEDGADGRVDIVVELDTQSVGAKVKGGSINFRERGGFNRVEKDQLLAVLVPPLEGKPGHNVLGEELPARDGVKKKLPRGVGTKVAEEGCELRAA